MTKKNKNYRRIRISTRISKENERKEKNVSSLLVVGKDGNPKGLITERDLVSQKGMHQ
jgi:CBS domain-containing protein